MQHPRPAQTNGETNCQTIQNKCRCQLIQINCSPRFDQQLKRLIVQLGATGRPSIPRVAKHLGFSVRSLQRELKRHGLTFSVLVDRARYERAQALLGETEAKICDISAMLGYNDASSFSRAFMRWSGVSPRKYRCDEHRHDGKAV